MAPQMLAFGNYRFDRHSLALYEDSRLIPLTAKAAQVLAMLLDRPGDVVAKEEFLAEVWKDTFVEPRSLTQCIFLLRKALNDQEDQAYIETVAKRGYRFAVPVTPVEVAWADFRPVAHLPPEPAAPPRNRVHVLWVVFPMLAFTVLAVAMARRFAERPRLVQEAPLRLSWSGSAREPDISADGKFVVFAHGDAISGGYAIYRQEVPDGFPRAITPPYTEPVESPAISSDGKQVAFRSSAGDGQILIVPADGSRPPVPLPDSSRGRQPRWQPGRNALAYWVASEEHIRDFGIVVLQAAGPPGKPVRMFDGFDTAFSPLWAPDGSALLTLGTQQSSVPEREYDAWVNPFRQGASSGDSIRTGLFDLLRDRGLYSTVRDRARITVTGWHAGYLYFSIHNGHSANLYRVALGANYRVYGGAEQLTTTTQLLTSPRISATGLIALASMDLTEVPWRLSADGVKLEKLRAAAGWLSRLSVAEDPGRYAAEVYAAGSPIRILSASFGDGPDRILASGSVAFPVISPDGRMVAWRAMDGRLQAMDAAPAEGGPVRRICSDCGAPEEWVPDSAAVVYHTGGVPARIGVVQVATGEWRDWIIHPDYGVFGPRLYAGPAGRRWIAFYAENTPRTRQIFIAPADGWTSPPVSSWIPVTGGEHWDSSPVWAPQGDAVYFVSQRDGHRCLYVQRLHPVTKKPVGEPAVLRHLHSSSHPLAGFNRARGAESLRFSGGNLYFILDSVTTDVWTIQLHNAAAR